MKRLVAILALGCAACAAEAPAPAAAALAPRHTGAWQQFCEQASSVPHANALAAARGVEGWELVAMYNGVLCYKRPGEAVRAPAAPASQGPTFVPVVRDPGF